ncbi:MAG: NAD(+) diphosphatase [Pseudohongiellaceae bacterium]
MDIMLTKTIFPGTQDLTKDDRFVVFFGDRLATRNNEFIWCLDDVESIISDRDDLIYIDEAGAASYYLLQVKTDPSEFLAASLQSLRSLLFSQSELAFTIAGKAAQLIDWYNSHRYCGACGTETKNHSEQRAVICESCKRHYFPRINPCAIMLVVDGDHILLARSARFKSNFFSCLAGFMEVGETAEETVAREVKEEVGVEIENIRYLKSQSWPFPSQLMLGFIADYKSGEIIPEPGEIEEANWYHVNDLPNVPAPGISVAGELIQHYVKQVRGQ